MRKIDLMKLLESADVEEMDEGIRLVGSQEIIDIKRESVEMVLILQGTATTIFKEAGKKEAASISKGEACFYGTNDESVMLHEDSLALVIDKKVRKANAGNGRRIGLFSKKEKAEDSNEEEVADQPSKGGVLNDMMPRVRQAWFQVAGPLSASVVNDEEHFKGLASTVYAVLPMPIRMVVKEEFFVSWCYEKRHFLLIEAAEPAAGHDDKPALPEADAAGTAQVADGQIGEK